MRIQTSNIKNPNYSENHEIYVGTAAGTFKRVCVANENPHALTNIFNINSLEKDTKITRIEFENDEKTKILIGRTNSTVELLDVVGENNLEGTYKFSGHPITGVGTFDGKLIAGLQNGEIHILENSDPENVVKLISGDNISKMRQCKFDKKLIATGGKERQNKLKIFDLIEQKKVFESKNLPNDFLQLEVPIWDTDHGFIDPNLIATCSRYGYVRLYDTRAQRRPIQKYSNENQMSFTCLTANDNKIYAGTTMGALKAFDTRNFKNFIHTYKGFTGGITELHLDESGKYLASASLDRYVRVHHVDSTVLLYQCYIKSKATGVLIKSVGNLKESSEENEDNEENEANEDYEDIQNDGSDEEYNAMFENMERISENINIKANDEDNEITSNSTGNILKKKRKSKVKDNKIVLKKKTKHE